jgi:hypothetical protein
MTLLMQRGSKNTANGQCEIVKAKIEEIGAQRICHVVTDNPSVNKSLRRLIEADYAHIIGSCCVTHQFDLLAEDVGKLTWTKGVLTNCNKIVTNVKNHDMILKTFRSYSNLDLLKPGETRFATQFIMLDRLKSSKESLIKTYIDPTLTESVNNKSDGYKNLFECAKDLVFDPHFWVDVDYLCSILEPIIILLRLSDNSLKILIGFIGLIYYKHYLFTLKISNFSFRNRNHKSDMVSLVNKRRYELHSPYTQ